MMITFTYPTSKNNCDISVWGLHGGDKSSKNTMMAVKESSGKVKYTEAQYQKGMTDPDFIEKHHLNTKSQPADLFQAFFPDRPKSQDRLYKGFSISE